MKPKNHVTNLKCFEQVAKVINYRVPMIDEFSLSMVISNINIKDSYAFNLKRGAKSYTQLKYQINYNLMVNATRLEF